MKITNFGEVRRAEKRIIFYEKQLKNINAIRKKHEGTYNKNNQTFMDGINRNIELITKKKNDLILQINDFIQEKRGKN